MSSGVRPTPVTQRARTHIHVQRLWQANRNRCSRRHRLPAVSGRWQILRRGGWAALSLLTASQRSDGVNCSLSANGGARPRSKRTKTFRYCFCWGLMMARHFQVWRRRRERLSFLISSGISIKCFCKWLSNSNGAVTQTQLRKPCGWPVVARRLRCVRRRPIYWPHYVVACCAGRMPLVLDDHCPRPAKQGRSRLRCEP